MDLIDELREEKVVATLTKKELDLLDSYQACQRACEKIVRKIVREHELAEIQLTEFWRAIEKKYKLRDHERNVGVEFRIEGDKVVQFNQIAKDLDKLITRSELGDKIRKQVYDIFGLK